MSNDQIVIFFNTLLKLAGSIAVIYGGVNVIIKIFTPYKKLNDTVEDHTDVIQSYDKRLEYLEDANKLSLRCMLSLIDHQITGNGVNSMSAVRKDIEEFLTR